MKKKQTQQTKPKTSLARMKAAIGKAATKVLSSKTGTLCLLALQHLQFFIKCLKNSSAKNLIFCLSPCVCMRATVWKKTSSQTYQRLRNLQASLQTGRPVVCFKPVSVSVFSPLTSSMLALISSSVAKTIEDSTSQDAVLIKCSGLVPYL